MFPKHLQFAAVGQWPPRYFALWIFYCLSANNKEFPLHVPMSLMVSPGSKGGSSISANLLASLRTYTKDTSTNRNSLCFHKPSSLHLQVNSIKDNKYSKILKYCLLRGQHRALCSGSTHPRCPFMLQPSVAQATFTSQILSQLWTEPKASVPFPVEVLSDYHNNINYSAE